MKQSDRFERVVNRSQWQDDWGVMVIDAREATALLRKEHAWMRRMVRAIQKAHLEHMDEWIVLDSVLRQLDQRRK